MPLSERPVHRIIAEEFPEKKYSKSVYDMPKSSEVIGINLPVSTTKRIEYSSDPRLPPKLPVKSLVHHGNYNTANSSSSINTPGVNFMEKSS